VLSKLSSLFNFRNIFSDAISEWRLKEEKANAQNIESYPDMYLPQVSILQQVANIYTITIHISKLNT